ncbi:MAG: hypothetical protein AAF570_07665, partial [Bacteroidota bacterium]
MGGEITFTCLGGNQYQFTVNFYRDCAGISAPTSVTLQLNSASCGASASVTLSQISGGVEVSPLCPAQIGNSTCNGGALPGVEQYVYQGTYTFTQNCNDWNVSYSHCCRNSMITNLLSASSNDMYIEATFDNTGGMCNSSPVFTSLPVPYICDGQLFCYNHGAVDPDGDSLVYSLVNAQDGPYPGTNIAYNAPYSATYPITDINGSVTFDSQTGSMCVTPSGTQVSVVTILVEEYRNGVLIGSTMRDLQVVVQSCANQQPLMAAGGIQNLSADPVQLDSNSVEVCPGGFVSFDVVFNDPNAADNVTLTTNLGIAIPGATWTVSGTNPVTGSFTWTPGGGDIGFHNFAVVVQDDGCPILGSQVFAFDIDVLDGTYAGPDLDYCPAGGPLPILATGGTVFNWNTLAGDPGGLSCTNCQVPMAAPAVTSTYEVVSNLSATCKNRDTVTVNVVPDFLLDAGPDATICKYGVHPLNATAGPGGFNPFVYSWSPSDSLTNTNTANPSANPTTTTTYYLTTTSNVGCTITDSLTVTVSGVAPQVIIDPEDTLCQGDLEQLNARITFECDTTAVPCSGPTTTVQSGSGGSATSTYGPSYMFTTTAYSIRRQFIYTAAELEAMGFTAGKITAIGLEYSTANSAASNVRIKMGCTTQDQWNVAPYNFVPNLIEVKTPFTLTPVVGWNSFNLDYAYNWDGVSNLVVEFCTDMAQNGTSSSVHYLCSNPVAYRTLYSNQANNSGCTIGTGFRTSCRPHMQFTFCEALPASLTYSWSPAGGLNNPNILNPTFNGPASSTYTLTASDAGCNGGDVVTLEVAPTFVPDLGNDTSICRNNTVNFNATAPGTYAPYTYNWDLQPDLSCTTCPNPTVGPAVSTTYYADVRSSLGCTVRDSIVVTVAGVAPFVRMDNDT